MTYPTTDPNAAHLPAAVPPPAPVPPVTPPTPDYDGYVTLKDTASGQTYKVGYKGAPPTSDELSEIAEGLPAAPKVAAPVGGGLSLLSGTPPTPAAPNSAPKTSLAPTLQWQPGQPLNDDAYAQMRDSGQLLTDPKAFIAVNKALASRAIKPYQRPATAVSPYGPSDTSIAGVGYNGGAADYLAVPDQQDNQLRLAFPGDTQRRDYIRKFLTPNGLTLDAGNRPVPADLASSMDRISDTIDPINAAVYGGFDPAARFAAAAVADKAGDTQSAVDIMKHQGAYADTGTFLPGAGAPPPSSTTWNPTAQQSFGTAALNNTVPTVGGHVISQAANPLFQRLAVAANTARTGETVGGMEDLNPWYHVAVGAATLGSFIFGSDITKAAGDALNKVVFSPEFNQAMTQSDQQAQQAHPVASFAGGLAPLVGVAGGLNTAQVAGAGRALAAVAKGAKIADVLATADGQTLIQAKNALMMNAGLNMGVNAAAGALQGKPPTLEGALKDAGMGLLPLGEGEAGETSDTTQPNAADATAPATPAKTAQPGDLLGYDPQGRAVHMVDPGTNGSPVAVHVDGTGVYAIKADRAPEILSRLSPTKPTTPAEAPTAAPQPPADAGGTVTPPNATPAPSGTSAPTSDLPSKLAGIDLKAKTYTLNSNLTSIIRKLQVGLMDVSDMSEEDLNDLHHIAGTRIKTHDDGIDPLDDVRPWDSLYEALNNELIARAPKSTTGSRVYVQRFGHGTVGEITPGPVNSKGTTIGQGTVTVHLDNGEVHNIPTRDFERLTGTLVSAPVPSPAEAATPTPAASPYDMEAQTAPITRPSTAKPIPSPAEETAPPVEATHPDGTPKIFPEAQLTPEGEAHRTKLLASGLSPLISEGQSINNDQRAKAWAALDPATRSVAEWYRTRLGAIDGDGTPTPPADGALNQSAPTQANATDPLGFYSHAESVVAAKMGNRMNADDLGRMLTANGVKPDEMKYTGLGDFLATRGSEPVTRAEVQSHLADNKVQLGEITKGSRKSYLENLQRTGGLTTRGEEELSALQGQEDTSFGGSTKYHSYQLPGGKNYTENLLTLPIDEPKPGPIRAAMIERRNSLPSNSDERARLNNQLIRLNEPLSEPKPTYTSSHWDEPNVVAHYRTNDRTGPNGEKILHVEEVQSDMHQEGRKNGYADSSQPWNVFDANTGENISKHATEAEAKSKAESMGHGFDYEDSRSSVSGKSKVPDAPFSKTWHELVMRRILRQAAEGGYDRVSWTPGEDQAARYDLSKQISRVVYHPIPERLTAYGMDGKPVFDKDGIPSEKIGDHIGQEAAAKLLSPEHTINGAVTTHELRGDDLRVGGEGMKGFYDKIIPDYLNKFGKRFGAKVDTTEITHKDEQNQLSDDAAFTATPRDEENPDDSVWDVHSHTGEYITSHDSEQEAERDAEDRTATLHKNYGTLTKTVPSMAITPAMRAHLLEQGNPLFQGEATDGDKRPVTATLQFDRYGVANIKYHKGANDSTPIHEESGHVMMNDIYRDADTPGGNGFTDQERSHVEDFAKPKNLDAWRSGRVVEENKLAHEKFANGAEKFFATGKAPTEILRRVFEKLGARIRDIYRNATGDSSPLSVQLTPQMHAVYGKLLGGDGAVDGATGDKYAGSINTEKTGLDAATQHTDAERLGLADKPTNSLASLRTSARTEGLSVDDLRNVPAGRVPDHWMPNAPEVVRRGAYTSRLNDLYKAAHDAKNQAQGVYDADPSAVHLADLTKMQQDADVMTRHRDAYANTAGTVLATHKQEAEPFFGPGAGVKADDILAPSPKQSRAAADAGVSPKSRNYDSKPRQFANIDRSAVIAELQRLHQGGDTGDATPLNQSAPDEGTLNQSAPPSERGRLLANLGAYHIEGGNKTYVAFSKVMQDEAKAGGFTISEGDMTAAYRNARYMIGQQVVGGGGSPSSQTEFAQNIGSMLGKEGAADFANAAQAHPAVGPDAFDRFVRLGPAGVTTGENTAIRGEFTKALAEKASRGGATPAQAAAISQATMELADARSEFNREQAKTRARNQAATAKATAGQLTPDEVFDRDTDKRYGGSTKTGDVFRDNLPDDVRAKLLSKTPLTADDEQAIFDAHKAARASRPAPQQGVTGDADAVVRKVVADGNKAANRGRLQEAAAAKRAATQATMTPIDAYTKSLSGRFGGHDGAKAFRAAVGDDVMQKIVDGTELTTAESRKVGDAYLNAVPKNAAKPVSANAAANKALNGAVADTRAGLEAQRIASLKPKDRVREQLLKIAPTDADGNVDPKYLDRLNKELLPLAPDDTHAIANVLSKYSRSILKNLQTAYRSGLLSGPQTLGKIGISHILYMAAEEAKRVPAAAADAAMSRVFGTERTVGGGDLLATGRAIGTAITKGAPEALHILRHGEASLALKGHNPYNAATGINSEPLTAGDSRIQPEYSSYLPGKAGDAVNAAVRAPLRAHSAFFHMMQTGLIDRGLSEWANLEATKQADPALKGRAKSDAVAKSAADLRLNPTQEGLDFAHNFAREQLFTNDNKISEGMSDVRKGIAARDKAKGTNFLPGFDAASTLAVPFNKVPVNVGGKAIEYGGGLATSAAYTAKAIKAGLFHDNVTPEQQRIWANSIGRGAIGAGAMLLGSLIHRGVIKGANINPPDAKDHEWGSATGLGRDWQTSTVQPTMSPLYAGAYAADRAKANHRSFPNVADYAAGATRSVLLSAADNPYLRLNETLAPLFDAAAGRQDNPYTKGAPAYYRAAGGFAGSFVPTLAAETAAQFDPKHDVRNKGNADTSLFNYIMNSVKNRIPGERATLPAYPFPEASGLIPGLPSTPAKPR